jgi:RimJ/RimL family protein N-acetyltransferase
MGRAAVSARSVFSAFERQKHESSRVDEKVRSENPERKLIQREDTKMDIQFMPVALADIREAIQEHLVSLPAAIDSYLEGHIKGSAHYQIRISGEVAGFASIHKESLVTQFSLKPSFKHWGQSAYNQTKKLESVQSALVPTCDEFFLSHALDDYHQIVKQAYLFAVRPDQFHKNSESGLTLRPAQTGEEEMIQRETGDFFGNIAEQIGKEQLFLTLSSTECVGFGIMEKGELSGNVASIGMHVPPRFRRQGVGTATLHLLVEECRRQGRQFIAGCWYYNHLSKKTLERTGLYTQTRLLRIEY